MSDAARTASCSESYNAFLARFAPFARTGRVHLIVAGQELVTNEESRCDFIPGRTELTYRSAALRWWDDASYARYQARDDHDDYEVAGDIETCSFDSHAAFRATTTLMGVCADTARMEAERRAAADMDIPF